jgi:hypothetical protein
VELVRPVCNIGIGKLGACEKHLPLLKSADNVYVLKFHTKQHFASTIGTRKTSGGADIDGKGVF